MKINRMQYGILLTGLLAIVVLGMSGFMGIVAPKSYSCLNSVDECPNTISYFGATLTGKSCTIEGRCAYSTCIAGCTDSICRYVKCPETEKCGNGRCDSDLGENCENCPKDCGVCCNDGAYKDCVCKGSDLSFIYCKKCVGGVWTSTDYQIKRCYESRNEVCSGGKCITVERETECSRDSDCPSDIISNKRCNSDKTTVIGTKKSYYCDPDDGKCYPIISDNAYVEGCIFNDKICENGRCVEPTQEDREDNPGMIGCDDVICQSWSSSGSCTRYRNVFSVCDGDNVYNCESGETYSCVERGCGGCSMKSEYTHKPSDAHCYDCPDGEYTTTTIDGGDYTTTTIEREFDPYCSVDSDCSLNEICDDGICVDKNSVEKCSTNSECVNYYMNCDAICQWGNCKIGNPSRLQEPCDGAHYLTYPDCTWDITYCKEGEKTCPRNEHTGTDGKCYCDTGYNRAGSSCVKTSLILGELCDSDEIEFGGGCYNIGFVMLTGIILVVVSFIGYKKLRKEN